MPAFPGGPPVTGPGPPPPPTEPGWYGLKFSNGVLAIVYWGRNGFQWGRLSHPPDSLNYTIKYLASDRKHLFGYGPAVHRFDQFIASGTAKQGATGISEIDHGVLGLRGAPVAVLPNGQLTWKTSPWTGSEANPVNIIPSPIPPSVGNSHLSWPDLFSPHLLFRIVKIVGGLALAYVGVRQLATVGGGHG